MLSEEQKAARLEKIARIKKIRAIRDSMPQDERTRGMTHEEFVPPDVPGLLGAARAGLQGYTLGASDELGALAAASAEELKQSVQDVGISLGLAEPRERKPFSSVYDEIYQLLEDERKQYREEYPKTAGGLNIAGSLGTGGATSLKLLPQAGRLRHLKYPLLSAEGAAAGYAGADSDKRNQSAALGAVAAPAIVGAGGLNRSVLDFISKRRVDKELGSGKDFVPLPMADDYSALPRFFRKIVAGSTGGGGIRDESRNVLEKAQRRAAAAQQDYDSLVLRQTAAKEKAKQRATLEAKDVAKKVSQRSENELKQLNTRTQLQTDELEKEFRNKAALNSLPMNVSTENKELISGLAPMDANKALDALWKSQGFQSVKGREFVVDTDDIINNVTKDLDNVAQREFGPTIKSYLSSTFKRDLKPYKADPKTAYGSNQYGMPKKNPKVTTAQGDIEGDALMQMRNKLRMRASELKEEGKGNIEANAYRKAADKIDSSIRKQLGEGTPGRQAFENDLSAWASRRNYDSATRRAVVNEGMFSPKDWVSTASSKQKAARGEAPLQEQASQTRTQVDALNTQAKEQGTALSKTLSAAKEKNKTKLPAKTERLYAAENLSLQQAAEQARRKAQATKAAQAALTRRLPQQDPGMWTQRFNTMWLGAPTGGLLGSGPLSPLTAYIAGIPTAKALGTHGAQRFAAGQTEAQKAIAKALKKYDASGIPQRLEDAITAISREQKEVPELMDSLEYVRRK